MAPSAAQQSLTELDEDPHPDQVVDLVELLVLQDHLLVDGVQVLGPARHLGLDAGGRQAFLDLLDDLGQVDVALGRPGRHHLLDLGVAAGVEGGEGEVLQLPLDVRDTEAVGQRGVNVEGFLRRALLVRLGHGRHGAHVVQAVAQLYEQDPGVLGHGHQHLAHGGGLGRRARVERDPLELGDAVDDLGHDRPELRLDLLQGDGRVLDRVVQQRGRQGHVVHAQAGQDGGDGHGVGDVRLAGAAELAVVGLFGRLVGLYDEAGVALGMALPVGGQQRPEEVGGRRPLAAPGQDALDSGSRTPP